MAHPAIIYYSTPSRSNLENIDPIWSLIYLGISIGGWIFIFGFAAYKIYHSTLGILIGVKKIIENGKSVVGEIVESKVLKQDENGKQIDREMQVSFTNFNGTKVQYPLLVTDTKPHLIRFEKGNSIRLKVDEKLKHIPYVMIEDVEVTLKYGRAIFMFFLWLISIGVVFSSFVYAFHTESMGYGWRFLKIDHPLVLSPLIAILFLLVFYQILMKAILGQFTSKSNKNDKKLLFYGKIAKAKVLDVNQTGVYINENPQVNFKLEFRDEQNVVHLKNLKKVIYMIDLPNVKQEYKSIFYLPENPNIIAFEEDIIE